MSTKSSSMAAPPPPKPIRFITNDGGPYAKRRRISSACATCRRRKTRCSGERPVCGTCKEHGLQCGGYGAHGDVVSSPVSPQFGEPTFQSPVKRSSQVEGSFLGKRGSQSDFESAKSSPTAGSSEEDQAHSAALSDAHGSDSNHSRLSLSVRNRMPYFRYFGPTAIMPGVRQMLVKVNEKTHSTSTPSEALGSPSGAVGHRTPSIQGHDAPTPLDPPVYDSSDMAPSPIITHLCETFFKHLGCTFPFLQKERFLRDLQEKQVDAILVDAVCALAARFSEDPHVKYGSNAPDGPTPSLKMEVPPPDRGQPFAQRAKLAMVDAYPCPSVAVVQAALLLAYDEFGANRDSGLWMYLGIAIRMAQDLGMQKTLGLRYMGLTGPTPQTVKIGKSRPIRTVQPAPSNTQLTLNGTNGAISAAEQREAERERIDTFWAVFFLDRAISSGTGRPVTLRDEEIEVAFPPIDKSESENSWPHPFPALIRVVHLYGRVTDVLNAIKEASQVTPDVIEQLALMESNLTEIYQSLSPKLHFNAINFQQYVQRNQGTNFILLHFWFHTLIVLLHQPTLLHTFDAEIQQLFPNSRELSMSSAKTVADILAFTELIDAKSGVGNPFTSQPTYIAACAFLKERSIHTASSNSQSRAPSPLGDRRSSEIKSDSSANGHSENHESSDKISAEQKLAAKHSLLAAAANQNYQRCYRALQQLEHYWAGTKYILTVLDQKAKGVGDPLLYTQEEMESALEVPMRAPAFTSPGWRRKLSWGAYLSARPSISSPSPFPSKAAAPGSPGMDPSQAIGWSLTGSINSPRSANLAMLYSSDGVTGPQQRAPNGPQLPSIAAVASGEGIPSISQPQNYRQPYQSSPPVPSNVDARRMSEADLLLNLHSPYPTPSPRIQNNLAATVTSPNIDFVQSNTLNDPFSQFQAGTGGGMPYSGMMIESQDIDMSMLADDMMWLEYLPQDFTSGFGGAGP